MAQALGQEQTSANLTRQAQELKQRFEDRFWSEALGTYVLALDGRKKPCAVQTSNAGHALWTGIASPDRAARLVTTLLSEKLFCGWGVRTVGSNELRYNPMSYHNGSVWPHDNSMIAAGFARYGYKKEAAVLLASLLDASRYMELNRLPELFCGFHKRPGVEGPTLYPVACSPQAWSAGAAYLLLSSCLGIRFMPDTKSIVLSGPHLPQFLDEVRLTGIGVGEASVDLEVRRHTEGTSVEVLRNDHSLRVEVESV